MMLISDYSTLTFDCYGTLIDWETGVFEGLKSLFERSGEKTDRDTILQTFAKVESAVQSENPDLLYSALLERTHRQIAQRLNAPPSDDADRAFAASIERWPAFPDSAASLQYLKQYFKLVILSNVDRVGFAYSNKHLKVEFDSIYTAEDVGCYKPNHRNFHHMLTELEKQGIDKSKILHTAQSQFHDIVPATALGFTTCWIDRRALQAGSGATPIVANKKKPDFYFQSMAQMVDAHRMEREHR